MTREEFERKYCSLSGISREQYNEWFVTLPCKCGDEECKGWAAVRNSKTSIEIHNELYNRN